jgi:hypothetical protein
MATVTSRSLRNSTTTDAMTALPVPEERNGCARYAAFVAAFLCLSRLRCSLCLFLLCLFLIAKKLNVQAPWTAWVPVVNIWTLLQAAGKPCWWVLLFFIPLVGFIVIIHVWMCITENLGRNKWMGLLILIPIVSLVYIGVLAFSKQEPQLAYSHS